jgi:F-type H+-transporting ATPase subunit alpha
MAEIATIARPYAEAVFKLAESDGRFDDWSALLDRLDVAVAQPDVRACAVNPNVRASQLTDLLVSVMGDGVSAEAKNFVGLLVENHRLTAVHDIHELYEALRREREGVVEAEIASAYPLDDAQLKTLVSDLERRFKRKVEPNVSIDKELIGGVRIAVGDEVIDGSVRGKLSPAEISDLIKSRIQSLALTADVRTQGTVVTVTDGICRVHGLSDVMQGEMLEFPKNTFGLALNLERDSVGAVILGEYEHITEGDTVKCTGRILEVPVGPELIGRVVNSLGQPIDGKGPINAKQTDVIEKVAPGVITRRSVGQPVQTGLKAIDSMVPIGRGQRELIIGDRQTGKTAVAVDTIINQKGKDLFCVYVAIGQKASTIANVVRKLEEHGAMEFTIVVAASASESAAMQYIAPYSGCTMGEYFRDRGQDALIIYDDLTKQAWAYRQISLLLRRPPGREAYPGDVFYLHSRLLERAARVNEEYVEKLTGGKVKGKTGSLTALPVIETQAGDVTAFVPTNVISITDGQIFLETDLFNAGIRPAINAGISVSRVGGAAQTKVIKKLGGGVRLALAQYRELAAFAQFASDLDEATRKQLERGRRVTELMKQPQYQPQQVWEMALTLFAVNNGYFDDVDVKKALPAERSMRDYIKEKYAELCDRIENTKDLSKEDEETLHEAVKDWQKNGTY